MIYCSGHEHANFLQIYVTHHCVTERMLHRVSYLFILFFLACKSFEGNDDEWDEAVSLGWMHWDELCIALAFVMHKFIQNQMIPAKESGLENHGRNSPDPAWSVWIVTRFHPF